jgi:hypothetical protein
MTLHEACVTTPHRKNLLTSQALFGLAIRKFDREFVDDSKSTESFLIAESGLVSYEAARLVYGRLGP